MTDQIIQLENNDTFDFDVTSKVLTIHKYEPPTNTAKFVWITDLHLGRTSTISSQQVAELLQHVDSLEVDFIVMTGDLVDHGTFAELQELQQLISTYVGKPLYLLPGNHEEEKEYDDPGPNNYDNYIATFNEFRWSFELNGYKLIGFTSQLKRDDPFRGFGWVSQEDIDFVDAELNSMSTGHKAILMTHFPLNDYYGANIKNVSYLNGDLLRQTFVGHDIVAFLSGHRHLNMIPNNVELEEVNGSCAAYNNNGNVRGGFQVITMKPDKLIFDHYDARTPFGLQPCTNYTPCNSQIIINDN